MAQIEALLKNQKRYGAMMQLNEASDKKSFGGLRI